MTAGPDQHHPTVRAMTPADLPVVRQIYQQGIDTGEATFETQVPPGESLWDSWLPGHRWAVEQDGRLLGWAAARRVSARECYAGVVETSVYVADGSRGGGVGAALLQRQTEAADTGGLWTLQTSIFPENLASLRLHHRHGFRTVGVRERIGLLHGRWRDTVLLERRRTD